MKPHNQLMMVLPTIQLPPYLQPVPHHLALDALSLALHIFKIIFAQIYLQRAHVRHPLLSLSQVRFTLSIIFFLIVSLVQNILLFYLPFQNMIKTLYITHKPFLSLIGNRLWLLKFKPWKLITHRPSNFFLLVRKLLVANGFIKQNLMQMVPFNVVKLVWLPRVSLR